MYCRFSIGLTLLLGTIYSARAVIDFTPVVEEYTSQGFVYRKVSFKEEKGPIKFVPPLGWNVRGSKDVVQLNPPNRNFVEATISATPLSAPAPFDDARVDALKQQVLRDAPAASQSIQLVRCNLNPVPMAPYPSVEIVISYKTLGRVFEKGVIFVEADDTRLAFRLTAPREEFEGLSQDFRGSIASWQWRQPGPEKPVAQNQSQPAGAR